MVSGLAILTSQWVLVVVTFLGALLVTAITGILSKSVTDSFNYLSPAIFGGMLMSMGISQWRYMIITLVLGVGLYFAGIPTLLITTIMAIFWLILSYNFYKRGIWVPKTQIEIPD